MEQEQEQEPEPRAGHRLGIRIVLAEKMAGKYCSELQILLEI